MDAVLRRIGDDAGVAACEVLFAEYLGWVGERLTADFGIRFTPRALERRMDDVRSELPGILGPGGRLYLAEVDGEAAGVGLLKPVSAEVGEVKRMYVRPAHRGRGVARGILEQLLDDARNVGYRFARLESLVFMTDAHALYRSLGFVDVPQFDGSEAEHAGVKDVAGFDLFMQLDLSDPSRFAADA